MGGVQLAQMTSVIESSLWPPSLAAINGGLFAALFVTLAACRGSSNAHSSAVVWW